jgi:type II secretory pathway pseudopilin PulG
MGAPIERGAALIDVVFTVGLVAVLSGIAIPTWQTTRQQGAARAAARYVAARLQNARVEALKRNVSVAVRFNPDDLDRFVVYADGDGDGVLETDITAGVDTPIVGERRWSEFTSAISLRIRDDVPEPDTGTALAANADPLRIGSSNLVSFNPLGSATSGTLYLAGDAGPQMAVRILGATGRIRVLRFVISEQQWIEE